MNIDLAIKNNVEKDLEDLNLEIKVTWDKLTYLIREKEKLSLYKLVSTLPSNEFPIHFKQENPPDRPIGS